METLKVQLSRFDKLLRRVVQGLGFGKAGLKSAIEIGPYGTDSNPIKDMIAIYGETASNGETVILGYLNKNQLAKKGEHRIYSTDGLGNVVSEFWLFNDGSAKITGDLTINAKVDNAVRFIPLNAALQAEVGLINTEIAKIAVVLNTLAPGSYTPTPITVDILLAKIADIHTT